jgi:hypothetical protein
VVDGDDRAFYHGEVGSGRSVTVFEFPICLTHGLTVTQDEEQSVEWDVPRR